MRLRQLFEAKETVGFIFGRFNPPHKGHRAAWEMLAKNDYWYVGTNKSTQGPKDPLPYDVKIKVMEAIWPEVADHIVPHQSWLTLASDIYKKHGDVALNVYTDEGWVLKALNQYNGVEGKSHGYYNFPRINSIPTPRLSSATALRQTVADDDREAFEKAAGVPADTPIDGKPFFDLVAEYLGQYKKEGTDVEEGLIGTALKKHKLKKAIRQTNLDRDLMIRQSKTNYFPDYEDAYNALLDKRDRLQAQLKSLETNEDASLDEAQTGDVYMRFRIQPPLDPQKSKPTLSAYAGFANSPSELKRDSAKMQFNILNNKQDIVNAIKKIIGDKVFIGAEKVVIYVDGSVNAKKFPQFAEFLDWVEKFGKEKVKIQYKPQSDDEEGEKGPGKKRIKQKWANPKDYKDDKIETTKYFTIDNDRLMRFLQKNAPTIMQAYRPAAKQFVMEPKQYRAFRNWMRSPDVVQKFGDTNVRIDKSKSFSQSVGREFEHMEDVSPEDEDKFHNELDDLVHKYFGDSPDEEKMKKKMKKAY